MSNHVYLPRGKFQLESNQQLEPEKVSEVSTSTDLSVKKRTKNAKNHRKPSLSKTKPKEGGDASLLNGGGGVIQYLPSGVSGVSLTALQNENEELKIRLQQLMKDLTETKSINEKLVERQSDLIPPVPKPEVYEKQMQTWDSTIFCENCVEMTTELNLGRLIDLQRETSRGIMRNKIGEIKEKINELKRIGLNQEDLNATSHNYIPSYHTLSEEDDLS